MKRREIFGLVVGGASAIPAGLAKRGRTEIEQRKDARCAQASTTRRCRRKPHARHRQNSIRTRRYLMTRILSFSREVSRAGGFGFIGDRYGDETWLVRQ
jgi:hypothetical protein